VFSSPQKKLALVLIVVFTLGLAGAIGYSSYLQDKEQQTTTKNSNRTLAKPRKTGSSSALPKAILSWRFTPN